MLSGLFTRETPTAGSLKDGLALSLPCVATPRYSASKRIASVSVAGTRLVSTTTGSGWIVWDGFVRMSAYLILPGVRRSLSNLSRFALADSRRVVHAWVLFPRVSILRLRWRHRFNYWAASDPTVEPGLASAIIRGRMTWPGSWCLPPRFNSSQPSSNRCAHIRHRRADYGNRRIDSSGTSTAGWLGHSQRMSLSLLRRWPTCLGAFAPAVAFDWMCGVPRGCPRAGLPIRISRMFWRAHRHGSNSSPDSVPRRAGASASHTCNGWILVHGGRRSVSLMRRSGPASVIYSAPIAAWRADAWMSAGRTHRLRHGCPQRREPSRITWLRSLANLPVITCRRGASRWTSTGVNGFMTLASSRPCSRSRSQSRLPKVRSRSGGPARPVAVSAVDTDRRS